MIPQDINKLQDRERVNNLGIQQLSQGFADPGYDGYEPADMVTMYERGYFQSVADMEAYRLAWGEPAPVNPDLVVLVLKTVEALENVRDEDTPDEEFFQKVADTINKMRGVAKK